MLNANRTTAINEIYEKWNGKLRTRNLEKQLLITATNRQKDEINKKIEDTNKSTNTVLFHTKITHPNGAIEEIDGDEKLIKRAFKACNALKTLPYYRQTALFTLTQNFLTDKQRYIIEKNKKLN